MEFGVSIRTGSVRTGGTERRLVGSEAAALPPRIHQKLALLIPAAVALLEEVLHRCTICAGRGDICIVAVAACLPRKAWGCSKLSVTGPFGNPCCSKEDAAIGAICAD